MDLINLIKSLPKCKLKRRKSDYLGFKMFQLFRILLCCIYAIITRHVDTWRLLLQMGTRARVLLVFMNSPVAQLFSDSGANPSTNEHIWKLHKNINRPRKKWQLFSKETMHHTWTINGVQHVVKYKFLWNAQ